MGETAASASIEQPTPKYLRDYRPPDYLIDTVFFGLSARRGQYGG